MAVGDHVRSPAAESAAARHEDGSEALPLRRLPRFLADMYGVSQPSQGRHYPSSNDNQEHGGESSPASELDCLRQMLAPALLAAAETRSREVGTGADRVLIQWGVIDEAAYLRRLSHHLRISFEPHLYVPRADIFLPDTQLHYAAQQGLLPFRRGGTLMLAISPRGLAARRLCHRFNEGGYFSDRICLVPTTQFNELLIARAGAALAHAAADGVRHAAIVAGTCNSSHPVQGEFAT